MTEFIAAHHVNGATGLKGQVSKLQVINVGGLNGDSHCLRQFLQPLLDGRFGVRNRFEQIELSLINHQFILGDIHTHDRL
ncbi:hypothetical protein D3C80_1486320 [compost metagenome]